MTAKNRTGKMQIKESMPLVAIAIVTLGAFALVIPAVVAQSTFTTPTNTGVTNVSIVSGAQNQNNGIFYSPANITVVLGVDNTVVWTNHDTTAHTVVALDNSYSATLQPGQTFTHTYTAVGVYKYHCTIHAWMMGSVTVLASPSTSSTSTSGSTGAIPEFPFEGLAAVALIAVVLASYLLVRQTKRG